MSGVLVAMAGLPGTGKSTLAQGLREALGAALLDKDEVRSALFGSDVDYSDAQDDLCIEVMLRAAGYLFDRDPARPVILDGRTFTRLHQLAVLRAAAGDLAARLVVIECVCPPDTALARLADGGSHPAANRTPDLYRRMAAAAEPIPSPKLVVDTGSATIADCLAAALAYVAG